MMKVKNQFYLGFLGFMGFKALQYFYTNDVTDLYYVMFFAFFGYFFVGRINRQHQDESYIENERNASHFTLVLALFLLGTIHMAGIFMPKLDLLLLVDFSFVILCLSYSIKLYLLERV